MTSSLWIWGDVIQRQFGWLGDKLNISIKCPQIVGLEWFSPSPLALHLSLTACDLILSELSVPLLLDLHFFPFSSCLNEKHKWVHSHLKDNNFTVKRKREYREVMFPCSVSIWFLSFDTLTYKFHCMYLQKILYIHSVWTAHVCPPFWQIVGGCQGVCFFLRITHYFYPVPSIAP